MKAFWSEVIISVVIIALLVLLLNPFGIFMPSAVVMIATAIFAVVFMAFASFVWRESARDEREEFNRMIAGRIGFFGGSAVLSLGIIVQSLQHHLDSWLVWAFAAMVVFKLAGTVYGRMQK